ncbi:hypothetical protein DMA15_34940 [Streptomyces sp. WAC 01529]|nr:hypothetical protein DMA15_34940 [Streptomyces sp. WAC 01529]
MSGPGTTVSRPSTPAAAMISVSMRAVSHRAPARPQGGRPSPLGAPGVGPSGPGQESVRTTSRT